MFIEYLDTNKAKFNNLRNADTNIQIIDSENLSILTRQMFFTS